VLDRQLKGRDWITGSFSIADIATAPWVRTLDVFYEAVEQTELNSFDNVMRWKDRFFDRPAVQRGLEVTP